MRGQNSKASGANLLFSARGKRLITEFDFLPRIKANELATFSDTPEVGAEVALVLSDWTLERILCFTGPTPELETLKAIKAAGIEAVVLEIEDYESDCGDHMMWLKSDLLKNAVPCFVSDDQVKFTNG